MSDQNPDVLRIIELEEEVARLKEQLQPYLDAEEAERKEEAFQSRVEWIVDICIPSYDYAYLKATNKEFPIRHPTTAGWWNGATVLNTSKNLNGDVHVEVKSYVGRDKYDTDDITLLKEWFEVENPTTMIQEWCVKETARIAEVRKESFRKEALAKIASLSKQLESL